jgi:hypothetical protein
MLSTLEISQIANLDANDRKYKKLRGHLRRATHWIARISRRDSKLFAHWQMGVPRGSMAGAV